jgi:hypothetical protein
MENDMGFFSAFFNDACAVVAEACTTVFEGTQMTTGQEWHACDYHQEPEWHNAFGTEPDFSVAASSNDFTPGGFEY